MKRGKHTCKVLKEIRRQIAEANDIEFITSECRYQGDCAGTCPKCEAEVQQLEQQLAHKRLTGKSIAVLGISSGLIAMTAPLVSCNHPANRTQGEMISDTTEQQVTEPFLEGKMLYDSTMQSMPGDSMGIKDGANPKKTRKTSVPPVTPAASPLSAITDIPGEASAPADTLDDEPVLLGEIPVSFAEYPGGTQAMMTFLRKNFQYPRIEAKVQGRCIVQFTVQPDGTVTDARVIRGVHPLYDQEALRVVGIMPKWNPGTSRGKAVKATYTLPFIFRSE